MIRKTPDNSSQPIPFKELDDDKPIDIRAIINKYLQYLPLFIITLLLSFTALFLYLRYKRPVYKSTIAILVKDDDKKTGTDLSKMILSDLISSTKSNVANELELVKSYMLMEKVVRKLDINTVYSNIGNVKTNELYKDNTGKFIHFTSVKDSALIYDAVIKVQGNKIFLVTKDKETEIANHGTISTSSYTATVNINRFTDFDPDNQYKAEWHSPVTMAQKILKGLTVETLNKDASIMKLSLESELPKKSVDILNTLSVEYNFAGIDEKNRMADNTIRFIDDRLALISKELGGVETNLQNFRQENNVIAIPEQGQFQLDRMKDIQATMDELDIQMQVTDMISGYVKNPSRQYSLAPSSLGIADPALLGQVKAYNENVLKREGLLQTLPPGNIAVIELEGQIQQLQSKIGETADNLKRSYRAAYAKTNADNNQLMQGLNSIPRKEKQLLEISRQQAIKEKLYIYLAQKREESAITRASAVSNSIPVDPATTDEKAVWPKKLALLGIALGAGLGLPLAYIYIKDMLSNKIVTRADILQYTKAPIIGEISHNTQKDRTIIADKTRGHIPEQFRIVRANMQYFLPKEKTKYTILVTSTMPGEGKTFISMNMGAVLASTGKKVVLLEFDMRKPKISAALNLPSGGKGLSTYLSGNASLPEILQPVPGLDNYFFIATGPVPPNPAELLLTSQLGTLFADLKMQFDHIIIDSPPTAIVSDAKILANHSDVNFYLVRQRYTLKRQLEFVNELYQNQVFNNMALLVNDVVLKGANGYYGQHTPYGYGNGYNYDYSYEYGYGEAPKKGWRRWFGKS